MSTRLTAIVVNYNGGALLADCVRSLLDSRVPVRVLVGDNGSRDESLAMLRAEFGEDPRLRIVEFGENMGFARANNRLYALARTEFTLFVNPDCLLRPSTLPRMLAAMDAYPAAGMAGCLVRNIDGSEQHGCRRHAPTPMHSLVAALRLDRLGPRRRRLRGVAMESQAVPAGPTVVDAISGAFMLVRSAAAEEVGVMDEGYFLHWEDLDWATRMRQAGWSVLFVPGAEALHVKGVCSVAYPLRIHWHKHRGACRYYLKFSSGWAGKTVAFAMTAAVWLRFALILPDALARQVSHLPGLKRRRPPAGVSPAAVSTWRALPPTSNR